MSVFSKPYKSTNMWGFDDLFPPFGLTSFISAVVICVLGFYMFKKLGTDGNVPVRDSTKNHSWTPIKLSSKVRYRMTKGSVYISFFLCFSHGIALSVRHC